MACCTALQRALLDENVNFISDEVTDIDLETRSIKLKNRNESLSYDVLVIALGGISNFAGVEGAAEHSIPFRKIAHADNLRLRMVDALDHVPPDLPPQDTQRALTFAVVGAGASGVELSTKMADSAARCLQAARASRRAAGVGHRDG